MKTVVFDERRDLIIADSKEEFLDYAVSDWIQIANAAIADHGFFAVALSGGSTPKLIFQKLVTKKNLVAWDKVYLFWSDERAVPPEDPESNYHMAMVEAGLQTLNIPKENIFRMVAERDLDANAAAYEKTIQDKLQGRPFDLVMLGMGEDGHTASLFPQTDALHIVNKLVAPNYVPQKKVHRMTFTFECINKASHVILYLSGEGKSEIVARVLTAPFSPDDLPSQRIGTIKNKVTFLLDKEASTKLLALIK